MKHACARQPVRAKHVLNVNKGSHFPPLEIDNIGKWMGDPLTWRFGRQRAGLGCCMVRVAIVAISYTLRGSWLSVF